MMEISKLARWVSGLSALVLVGACGGAGVDGGGPLDGDALDPVEGVIPALPFEPTVDSSPANTLILSFELGVTVGEANELLVRTGGEIVGGVPGVVDEAEGLLVIHTLTESQEEIDALSEELRADSTVMIATRDAIQVPRTATRPPKGSIKPEGWTWTDNVGGGNWGLELSGVPSMWNFADGVRRQGSTPVEVAVIENGFFEHPDLALEWDPPKPGDKHGTQVTGVLAATWDNELGIDGVSPFVELQPFEARTLAAGLTDGIQKALAGGAPVINYSLGNQRVEPLMYDPDDPNSPEMQAGKAFLAVMKAHEAAGQELPVFVAAAGNRAHGEVTDARWDSAPNTAALALGAANVVVVEAVERDATKSGGAKPWVDTNFGGHIAAPGVEIMTTSANGGYESASGTSLAVPHVAGVVAFMYATNPELPRPTLAKNPALDLLQANGIEVAGGTTKRMDAFATVMDIDRITSDQRALRRLCDIDDGSADGNMRIDPFDGSVVKEQDIDGDGALGDGRVDMSDFRRLRDWMLQVEGVGQLDGNADHVKRDLNLDGTVAAPNAEYHMRADFNGDGVLHPTAMRYVPGAVGVEATDLDVFIRAFNDDDTNGSELPELLESADMHIDLERCFSRPNVWGIELRITSDGTVVKTGYFSAEDTQRLIFTLPLDEYTIEVDAYYEAELLAQREQSLELQRSGQDVTYAPHCGGGSWSATLLPAVGALEINDKGQVLSRAATSGPYVLTQPDGTNVPVDPGHPREDWVHFLSESGAFAYPQIGPLETAEYLYPYADWQAISRNGVIAGSYRHLSQPRQAFVYFGGGVDGDPTQVLAGFTEDSAGFEMGDNQNFTIANNHAVNDAGTIVGRAEVPYQSLPRPAILSGDQPEFLPMPENAQQGNASFINNSGLIAGYVFTPELVQPVLWVGGALQLIPVDELDDFQSLRMLADDNTLLASCGVSCHYVLFDGAEEFEKMPTYFPVTADDGSVTDYQVLTIHDINIHGVMVATAVVPGGSQYFTLLLTPV